jgi:hypothetical protein
MRRIGLLCFVILLILTPKVPGLTPRCLTRCQPVPLSPCPPCPNPCANRLCLTLYDSAHAQKLIAGLASPSWCQRQRGVEWLGSRLHADFCRDPEVLRTLSTVLQCDPCWHVRRAAAWAIFRQRANTAEGLLSLYISSQLDPHYLVRMRALEAIDILTVTAPSCYKPLFERGDKLIAELRAKKYEPGSEKCWVILDSACAAAGISQPPPATTPSPAPSSQPAPERPPERLDLPRENPQAPRRP